MSPKHFNFMMSALLGCPKVFHWPLFNISEKPHVCNLSARKSGAGNGCVNFKGAWHFGSFCLQNPMNIKFFVLGFFFVFGGGGWAREIGTVKLARANGAFFRSKQGHFWRFHTTSTVFCSIVFFCSVKSQKVQERQFDKWCPFHAYRGGAEVPILFLWAWGFF